jgi:hypothetical protein
MMKDRTADLLGILVGGALGLLLVAAFLGGLRAFFGG